MELWIRNQDRDILLKVKSILIDDNNNDIFTQDYIGKDLATYTLGKYKTKERALEVLDEIQKLLQPTIIYNNDKEHIESLYLPSKVYEMPKE